MGSHISNPNEKPRILMIAPVFYPYPPIWPEGIVNTKLAVAMKNAGWQIDIIVAGYQGGDNRYPSGETVPGMLKNHVHLVSTGQRKATAQRLLNAARGFFLTGRLLQGLDWSLSVLDTAKTLHSRNKYDVILSRAVPDTAHFAALLVHRHTRIPWIANWNDPTPLHKFPPPYGNGPFSPLNRNIRKWFNVVCNYCTWHTFPSERLREYMDSYLPGDIKSKSSVIPHMAVRSSAIKPEPHSGFSLCYAGSVLPPRDVAVFFEGIRHFQARLDKKEKFLVRFLVDKPELVAESAKKMGIEEIVKIEETVPYSQMPESLSQSNILVIIEAPLENGIFMPSKIADYVQIGRPILALSPPNGTITDLLSKYGGGISVDCQSSSAVATALEKIHSHWKAGTLQSDYGSDSLITYLGEESVLGSYMDLFEKLSYK